ncbi:hypothetical protein BO70DRAFT_400517 [Aspergillus heteromorphus CBS 117.55]|uniref:Uncharacterized protein n=1 Tax=Aspergillus heteromorphus CBS 117.55 TaxID=1448321 RepID=A0A317V3M0_9EURO|nr:uncharacterized protein BO70DRAFT_400517 [Aspergillus heteromorphus CBS 117.55]PWY67941.1 hypothetical protein BO70DRAFT_400517 [Aspergillus heteromorphus CBS 117.55]
MAIEITDTDGEDRSPLDEKKEVRIAAHDAVDDAAFIEGSSRPKSSLQTASPSALMASTPPSSAISSLLKRNLTWSLARAANKPAESSFGLHGEGGGSVFKDDRQLDDPRHFAPRGGIADSPYPTRRSTGTLEMPSRLKAQRSQNFYDKAVGTVKGIRVSGVTATA